MLWLILYFDFHKKVRSKKNAQKRKSSYLSFLVDFADQNKLSKI